MATTTLLEQFVAISKILTGQTNLGTPKIAQEYLNRLQLQYPKEMQELFIEVSKFFDKQKDYLEFELKRKVIETEKHFPIVAKIVKIWYTGQFSPVKVKNIDIDKLPMVDEKLDMALRTKQQYDETLIWKEVHTHPPGDGKKRKYGHWHFSPLK